MYILIYLSVSGAPPFLFNQFLDALEWILQNNYGLQHVLHILDDFFITEPTRLKCLTSFSTLPPGFHVPPGSRGGLKNPWPFPRTRIYGYRIGQYRMEACLPDDKFNRAREILNSFIQRRSVRLFELQSLVGTLQFACKAVVPGKTFLQRMINLTKGVPSRFHHI